MLTDNPGRLRLGGFSFSKTKLPQRSLGAPPDLRGATVGVTARTSSQPKPGCSITPSQTLGGYGSVSDFPVERIDRDVRVCQIREGTSNV